MTELRDDMTGELILTSKGNVIRAVPNIFIHNAWLWSAKQLKELKKDSWGLFPLYCACEETH